MSDNEEEQLETEYKRYDLRPAAGTPVPEKVQHIGYLGSHRLRIQIYAGPCYVIPCIDKMGGRKLKDVRRKKLRTGPKCDISVAEK